MPKRSAEDKITRYKEKIRKLEEKGKKRRRLRVLSIESSPDVEPNTDTNVQFFTTWDDDGLMEPYENDPSAVLDEVPDSPAATVLQVPDDGGGAGLSPIPRNTGASEPCISGEADLQPIQTSKNTATLINGEIPDVRPVLPLEFLSALGDAVNEVPNYGEEIHPDQAQRWLPILNKGLAKEQKEKILNEYKIPSNCKLLKAPILNPEIAVAITESLKNRDKGLETAQQQLGLGITAINKAMTLLLTEEDKVKPIKILSDSCRISADLHQIRTNHRLKLITPSLDKSLLSLIENRQRDETLFGSSLNENIKTAKAIERQGLQIRKASTATAAPRFTASTSRNHQQGNWVGPSRFPTNRRGRGGLRTSAPPLPTAPPPPHLRRGQTQAPPPATCTRASKNKYHRAPRRN